MKPVKSKDTARYGVQVVYFGAIDKDLDATLQVITGRPGSYAGHSANEQRRDLFWPCFDKAEAAHLAIRIDQEISAGGKEITNGMLAAVKTEEQHWDEKIKAALKTDSQSLADPVGDGLVNRSARGSR